MMMSPSNLPRRLRAFTLVELLVVIGIIALLIGILMPALNKARQSAQSAACLSNLRQLGVAYNLYVNENKGFLPYYYFKETSTSGTIWYWSYIAGALGKRNVTNKADLPKVFSCPTATSNMSYGQNKFMNRPSMTSPGIRQWSGGNMLDTPPMKLIKVTKKQSRILNGDTNSDMLSVYIFNPTSKAATNWIQWRDFPPVESAPRRHGQNRYANYLFFDGHAESLEPEPAYTGIWNPVN